MDPLAARLPFRSSWWRVALWLLLPAALCCGARAEDGPPPVRHLAPDFMPQYRLDGGVQFEVVLPTRERPLGGCERTLPRPMFNRCLGATLTLSQRTLEATLAAARAAIAARAELPEPYRRRWSRLLDEVHASWTHSRNLECGQLVFLEHGPKANIFEERTQCLLATDRDRIADLKRRYGL